MSNVSVNAPKTPVTEGSSGVAAATLPNVCKMPGPPAPFVPTPLPNIGKSGTDPKKYSKTVTIEGKKVAIKGATFGSMGDVASKGTGGGIVSANVEGPTSFLGPGSMDVKFEGKNVQLLGDPMLNNCGPSGSPANAATMLGVVQKNGALLVVSGKDVCPLCRKVHGSEGSLKETPATQADAAQLEVKLTRKIFAGEFPEEELPWGRMLGVAQCKCGQKYADHSSNTIEVFCKSVSELGWNAPKPGTTRKDVRAFVDNRFKKHSKNVKKAWARAQDFHEDFVNQKTTAAAYPPGGCAGPKALVLAMDHGARVAGLTERWFRSDGQPVSAKIRFIDKNGREVERHFAHGKSVPPCMACTVILPLLICPEEEMKCQHKKK